MSALTYAASVLGLKKGPLYENESVRKAFIRIFVQFTNITERASSALPRPRSKTVSLCSI